MSWTLFIKLQFYTAVLFILQIVSGIFLLIPAVIHADDLIHSIKISRR